VPQGGGGGATGGDDGAEQGAGGAGAGGPRAGGGDRVPAREHGRCGEAPDRGGEDRGQPGLPGTARLGVAGAALTWGGPALGGAEQGGGGGLPGGPEALAGQRLVAVRIVQGAGGTGIAGGGRGGGSVQEGLGARGHADRLVVLVHDAGEVAGHAKEHQ